MLKLKAVVFDMDHTLYDRYETLELIAPMFYKAMKAYISPHVSEKDVARALIEADREAVYYGWERVHEYLCAGGLYIKNPPFELYRDSLIYGFENKMVPFEFTDRVLAWCRQEGYKTALITNGMGSFQHKKIKGLGFDKYMDEIIVCGDFGLQKPGLEPFIEMASRLGFPPAQMLYVGDNPWNDVDASRKAGYIPVWVRTIDRWPEELTPPVYSVKTVEELPELIKEIEAKI